MGLLEGKRALVTGGGSGIGRATARRLHEEGARVVVVDVEERAGKETAAAIDGTFLRANVSSSAELAEAFRGALEELGGLDVVHLNAGVVTRASDIADLSDDEYRRVVGVNVDGVVFGAREAIRSMRRTGGGVIVATASMAGLVPYATDPVYGLTKHAVVGFVRGLAEQLANDGIRLNCICPGIVDTPLLGPGRDVLMRAGFPLIPPEEVAEGVMRAITSERTGEAWIVQAGREPEPYRFRGVPGPRTPGAEGMAPPPEFRMES
jgi:NAD(P)-dependent dehydrogenase (short-subunit alcohol dehydrogenase family)